MHLGRHLSVNFLLLALSFAASFLIEGRTLSAGYVFITAVTWWRASAEAVAVLLHLPFVLVNSGQVLNMVGRHTQPLTPPSKPIV